MKEVVGKTRICTQILISEVLLKIPDSVTLQDDLCKVSEVHAWALEHIGLIKENCCMVFGTICLC